MAAKNIPSGVQIPIAVEPNLMASMAYSTWKRRPSGEKVFTPLSYSERVRNMVGCNLVKCYARWLTNNTSKRAYFSIISLTKSQTNAG